VGTVTKPKIQILKTATQVVEDKLGPHQFDQYFAAVIENKFTETPSSKLVREAAATSLGLPVNEVQADVFEQLVTGVKGDERCYGNMVGVRLREESREAYGWLPDKLLRLESSIVEEFPTITRVAMLVKERKGGGSLSVIVRAVSTRDYMTAAAASVPWKILKDISHSILENDPVGRVYYDVTPKPPATIEFE